MANQIGYVLVLDNPDYSGILGQIRKPFSTPRDFTRKQSDGTITDLGVTVKNIIGSDDVRLPTPFRGLHGVRIYRQSIESRSRSVDGVAGYSPPNVKREDVPNAFMYLHLSLNEGRVSQQTYDGLSTQIDNIFKERAAQIKNSSVLSGDKARKFIDAMGIKLQQ